MAEKSTIDQILEHNARFVEEREYEQFKTDKYPDKKLAVVSCMDTRLTALLMAALGLKNGDAKIINNTAGANDQTSAMRGGGGIYNCGLASRTS